MVKLFRNISLVVRTFFYLLIAGAVLLSCTHSDPVERIKSQLEIINPDLEIQFPGQFLVERQCFILFDPLVVFEGMKILDKQTGKKIVGYLDIGKGPEEFVTPWCGYSLNDTLIIYDLNALKKMECNIDSLYAGKVTINPTQFPFQGIDQLAKLKANQYVGGVFKTNAPFCLIKNNEIKYEFGKYPIDESISNTYDVFQGEILYHAERHVLGYAINDMPYLSLYECEGEDDTIRLLWESRFKDAHYTIGNRQLHWNSDQPAGISWFTFTKDYIACLVKEMRLEESFGRGEAQMPRAIYLYDYDGKLRKIIELNLPSNRISATTDDNVIYLISLDEEYCLTKLDLREYNL
jgi:hypothetical protein